MCRFLLYSSTKHSGRIIFVVNNMTFFFFCQELVANCSKQFQLCSAKAVRNNQQPLFPSPSEGKRYYIRAEVDKEIGDSDSTNSHFSIEWNQTTSPYVSEVSSICKFFIHYSIH